MSDEKSLLKLGACQLADLVRKKEISPQEVATIFLNHTKKLNPTYRALSDIFEEEITEAAKDLEKNFAKKKNLALCGVPIIVDQSFFIKGKSRSLGSPVYKDKVHDSNDQCIQNLIDAGAMLLGRAYMSEFGMASWEYPKNAEGYRHPWIDHHAPPLFTGEGIAVAMGMAPLAISKDKAGASIVSSAVGGVSSFVQTHPQLFNLMGEGYNVSEIKRRFLRIGVNARQIEDLDLGMSLLLGEGTCLCKSLKPSDALNIGWSENLSEIFPYAKSAGHFDQVIGSFEKMNYQLKEVDFELDRTLYTYFSNLFSCEHYFPIVSRLEKINANASDNLCESTVDWLNFAQHVSGVSFSVSNNYALLVKEKVQNLLKQHDLLVIPSIPLNPESIPVFKQMDNLPPGIVSHLAFWAYTIVLSLAGVKVLTVPIKTEGEFHFTSIQVAASDDKAHLLHHFYRDMSKNHFLFNHQPDCLC